MAKKQKVEPKDKLKLVQKLGNCETHANVNPRKGKSQNSK